LDINSIRGLSIGHSYLNVSCNHLDVFFDRYDGVFGFNVADYGYVVEGFIAFATHAVEEGEEAACLGRDASAQTQ
jgi:hypothetical protein